MNPNLIPEPRLQRVNNQTPFEMFECQKMGVGRRFFDTVVIKGTLSFAHGKITFADEQQPIMLADEPWDPTNAERSSLKYAGDVLLTKPTTDVVVTGIAHAPGGVARARWECSVEVRRGGETWFSQRAQACGPRVWRHTHAGGWALTEPEETLAVPLRYELAYGGAFQEPGDGPDRPWIVYHPNPSGTGFFDARSLDTSRDYPAPQWQSHDHPITHFNHDVPLCGFGPVARPWASRLAYAGTYDDAWIQRTREEVAQGMVSDYAADFDSRFFQCAHPSLIAPSYLAGDEEIVLTGMVSGAERMELQLPRFRVTAALRHGNGEDSQQPLPLDTVHIDLDAATMSLCWRLTLDPTLNVYAAMIYAQR